MSMARAWIEDDAECAPLARKRPRQTELRGRPGWREGLVLFYGFSGP